jgi:hypothetical protein
MQRRKAFYILTIPVMTAGLLLSTAPANAGTPPTARTDSNPKPVAGLTVGAGYVIVNPASAVTNGDSTFYPTGKIGSDTLIVIPNPDGSLPGGLTRATMPAFVAKLNAQGSGAAAINLGVAASSAPASSSAQATPQSSGTYPHAYIAGSASSWGTTYTGNNEAGGSSDVRIYYSWNTQSETSAVVPGEGRGYYTGYQGSVYGIYSAWYQFGSAKADEDGSGSVPWGKVLSYTEFRAKCAGASVCGGYWAP